jgi:sulfur carrier protein
MTIIVNGEEMEVQQPLTLDDLLKALDVREGRTATMVNDGIVKRDARAECSLAEGDRVEVIHMVGGG